MHRSFHSAVQTRFRIAALLRTFGLLLALGSAGTGWAGSFQVNPIRIDLSGATRSVAVKVTNTGSEAVVAQVSVMSWAQDQGKDVLTPTREVIISPPIATIAPGKEQIVRVGLRRAPDAHRELSYRLFVQEVPPPPKPGFQGLQVALRIGLPVFVAPREGQAKAVLVWTARRSDPRTIRVSLQNQGTGHIQISDVALSQPGTKDPIAQRSGLVYVLPGQSRQWDLALKQPLPKNDERLSLTASTDAGRVETEIEVAGQ